MEKKNILITGGAGFIGSNLVEALLNDKRVNKVRVVDNLSTGFRKNINEFEKKSDFEFVWGDIRDINTCMKACEGIDIISHQAALGSVPRSINDPVNTNSNNITGTLNIFTAAKESGIKRIVYAASSSTYGDSKTLPKVEDNIGKPLSPYAITKLVSELYANVFGDLYNMELIGLRYFNVFGPKQDPHGAYAAVIPLFFKAALEGKPATINGDGTYSRDYTFVANAVQANIKALFTKNNKALNEVYNIACGERTDLNELWSYICETVNVKIEANHGPNRAGDIPHSLADVSKARKLLEYNPNIKVKNGLERAYNWYKNNL
ncbi:MAG TPA: SDR family oxidoreductase [Bacteroidetes bacterium]|nr:SDR family oxidoreductase [Bacteroidota bacterium]